MTTYRIGSSGLVHAPGLLAWGQNGYAFPKDRANLLEVFTGAWSGVPSAAFDQLLRKEISHRVEGDVVVFDAYVPTDPVKISAEVYSEAFECMPPSRCGRCLGVEMFHICEHLIDDLVSWYASWGGNYFQFNGSCRLKAGEIVDKVKAAAS